MSEDYFQLFAMLVMICAPLIPVLLQLKGILLIAAFWLYAILLINLLDIDLYIVQKNKEAQKQ